MTRKIFLKFLPLIIKNVIIQLVGLCSNSRNEHDLRVLAMLDQFETYPTPNVECVFKVKSATIHLYETGA